jgi:type I restriction enzyme M protein
MLDTNTKRRIDTARDILVGKVPDPKSQVEQITIALIYKFMDDMDAESEELGGKRKFFTGDFSRYGWAKLMSPGMGGHEMLGLHAEGITRMPENPGIPPLFRDIFKNAYLPYRDPETLKAFLKIIDEFTYDHSERLGDAFEYLLSVLGSQGDAGQFRTPRHIIDFMVEIIDPKKTETVLDPACGTAGFLISSYKHILKANVDARGNSTLTPDEKGRLSQNFKGYDISPDMVRLSLVNMYLHGFTDPHIYEYDTLTSEERWNEFADVILANPPFMSPKGGIKPHKRFSVPSNRSEVLFVDYMLEHLTSHGRAGIIVPEGIIFQSGAAYRRLRDVLLKEVLIGVISLPSGVFQPYSGVKTSILILDKRIAKSRPTILFSDIRAIGVSLGVKRTATERNDLPHVLSDYAAYYADKPISPHSWLVERSVVIANDCNLSGERYRPVKVRGSTRVVKLKEVCTLTKGTHSSTKTTPGPYPLIVTAKEWLTSSDYQIDGEAVCVPLISATGHGRADIKRIHFVSGKFAVANLLAVLQPKKPDVLNSKFLYLVLDLEKKKLAGLMKGAANVSMKVEDLAEFAIPLPPLEQQNEIVSEIEGYQKVMNGARAVLRNYRPHIPMQADWATKSLGEVCKFIDYRGKTPDKTSFGVPLITAKNVRDGYINPEPREFIAEEDYDSWMTRGIPEVGDVLFTTEAPLGNAAEIKVEGRFALAQRLIALCPNRDVLIGGFLKDVLLSKTLRERILANQSGTTVYGIKASVLKEIRIPLPPLEIQRQIVAEIEAEQSLVSANKELVERFEKKIQATLAQIWGKDETA